MADNDASRPNPRTTARRVGLAATASWALALTPLAAPAASADPLGWVADLFNPAEWAASAEATPFALGDPDLTALVNQWVYTPLHDSVEAWINNPANASTIDFINSWSPDRVLIGDGVDGTGLGTVDDDNTVFAFHDYCLTSMLLGGSDTGCSLYDGWIQSGAQAYVDAHHIPGMVTEFGATHNTDVIGSQLNSINPHMFGWLYWGYTDEAGSLVHDTTKPPVGDNVDDAIVSTLALPHPQAIAGIPNGWSFENGVFRSPPMAPEPSASP
ncbi:cellulase family glycosylhydrolase [Mycobacterium sp. M1]|uniref:Cellulase family glycosylhydrolase n=1 Tax=Mycolicibacter acidiphilus TaxID=2835306 RepID=A0ABS5RNL0_9MYCO|nr:cellulase family glycosylhydrolase [Mycolicibacter acidiphilus]MBS9535882.1 cellulase family glycosylhydrolase [Mycolicibacter acidiphilus]